LTQMTLILPTSL